MRISFTATLKTFRNGVSPPNVMLRGFAAAAAANIESRSNGLLKGAITDKGAEPNLASFNSVIQELCGKDMFSDAEMVFEEMNRKGLSPDETTYTCLYDFYCCINADTAHKFLNERILTGFTPSVATYNNLIYAYCRFYDQKRLGDAVGILRLMAEKGLLPDAVSYNPIISGFVKRDEINKALEMKAEALHKGILPDASTYRSLIDYMCSKGRLGEAFDLFREMRVSPCWDTYTNLRNAYRRDGQFSKAFHLHDQMVYKGFLPDFVTQFSPSLVTCNAFIHGLCYFNRFEEALGILRDMAEMGLSPDIFSYSKVISGLCQIQEIRKAYDLVMEMFDKKKGYPDEDSYESLMIGVSDEDTFTSVMNEYFAEGNFEKATCLASAVEHDGYLPVSFACRVLFNGLPGKAKTREAVLVDLFYQKCLEIPTYLIYDTLIGNCNNNECKSAVGRVKDIIGIRGLVDEAVRAHNTMLKGNYKRDGAIYNLLIFEYCSCNGHKAYDMYMEMVHYGFVSHMFSVLALIKVLHNDGRCKEMSWVIQNTLRSCNLNDSELLKVLHEIDRSEIRKCKIDAFLDVVAEIAMDELSLHMLQELRPRLEEA